MPRTVVLEDDSYFVLASYFNGIAHPPGYPLYTLLGHIFTYIPFDEIAFRVHLLSALLGALSCSLVWYISRVIVSDSLSAYVASLSLGFSTIFWSQSIIAEVYTLNVLLFLMTMIFSIKYKANSHNFLLLGVAFFYGLSLSNHWPLIVLSTPALIIILWSKRNLIIQNFVYVVVGFLFGVLPYVWMVLRSQMDPEISFFGPINSLSDFWFYISRQAYAGQDISPSAGLADKYKFLVFTSSQILSQFNFIGAFLGVIGFVRQWKYWPLYISYAFTAAFVGNTFLLIMLLGFDYDVLHQNIYRVYPLIAYTIFALWIALGTHTLISVISRYKSINVRLSLVRATILSLVLGFVFINGVSANYRTNDIWAKDFAKAVLLSLDKDAILFTHGDLDQGPLVYLNRLQSVRPDVTIYNSKGVLLSNRLFLPMKNTDIERRQIINDFILSSERPIYYTYGLPHNFKIIDYGLYRKINESKFSKQNKALITASNMEYLQRITSSQIPRDEWELMHYKLIVNDFCRLFLKIYGGGAEKTPESLQITNKTCKHYHGKLEHAEYLMRTKDPDWLQIDSLLNEAEKKQLQAVLKSDISKLDFLRGEMQLSKDDIPKAINSYKNGILHWQHPKNPAYKRLDELLKKKE